MKNDFDLKSPMPPIWMMYPKISQYSIGWRMGYGEGYKFDWIDWLDTLSDEDKLRYDKMFPRPRFWHDFEDDDHDSQHYNFIQFWQPNGAMQYTRETLLADENLSKRDYLFFWKPHPEKHGKYSLGQWQSSPFTVDVDEYNCAEQYMMAEKARVFEDKDIEKQIMQATEPAKMQKLGRKVKGFKREVWDKVKYSIVLTGNYSANQLR